MTEDATRLAAELVTWLHGEADSWDRTANETAVRRGDATAQPMHERAAQLRAWARAVRTLIPATWDPADLRDAIGKAYMLRFLPYLPDSAVKAAIGYLPPRRGHGYGRWEEFFRTESEARERMAYLVASRAIEDVMLHREVPGGGFCTTVLADWKARHPREWPVGTRVRLNVPPDRRRDWPWILPPDGTLATVALGPDDGRAVTWVPVGPVGEVFVRFDGEHDTNDGLPVRLAADDLFEVLE